MFFVTNLCSCICCVTLDLVQLGFVTLDLVLLQGFGLNMSSPQVHLSIIDFVSGLCGGSVFPGHVEQPILVPKQYTIFPRRHRLWLFLSGDADEIIQQQVRYAMEEKLNRALGIEESTSSANTWSQQCCRIRQVGIINFCSS
ncbi:hypothetical protein EJB05_03400 [Eragrostis curvula]|uniref:Uncharacterized protein n=1 Tax=Eragrostis curvula TaxID=38414 RepID=A0A5J9W769_9POAL|nr:hypothetical protein EJB05_03400 [Eragrostis curvula]